MNKTKGCLIANFATVPRELPLISDVEEQHAERIALTALQSEEPVGIDLLEEMAK
ncbi:hypothetical protein [Escherichia coli]|uniref:hypothetical protein n=1 Tax=Escherichia coli TaxID=562 RepID=UPI00217F37D4